MTNAEANDILRALPGAEVNDVNVVTTDGRHATADVVYSRNSGDLITARVEFTLGTGKFHHLDTPDDFPQGLLDEVIDECIEACMYQRDLNKAKN